MEYVKYPFNEAEVENQQRSSYFGLDMVAFDYPISPKENYLRNIHNHAVWQPTLNDICMFSPVIIADNVARGMVWEEAEIPPENWGGKDMFGVEWEYIEVAQGSMVKPGSPMLADVNDWKEVIKFPDINAWDWEDLAKRNVPWLREQSHLPVQITILTGFFERLISFMDFAGAAMALIDEDQRDAVLELFDALADLYIGIIDKYDQYFPGMIDEICVHDDWGGQQAPFFSEAVVREMIMPAMKRVVDHIHKNGHVGMLHCCGKVDMLVPCILDCGWDSWDAMSINDIPGIYKKYGDRLKVTLTVEAAPEGASKEEHAAAIKRFTDQYCHEGRGCIVTNWDNPLCADAQEALYRGSRIAFSQQTDQP